MILNWKSGPLRRLIQRFDLYLTWRSCLRNHTAKWKDNSLFYVSYNESQSADYSKAISALKEKTSITSLSPCSRPRGKEGASCHMPPAKTQISAHPCGLVRLVLAAHTQYMDLTVHSNQWRLWSEWTNAQNDLSLLCSHLVYAFSFCDAAVNFEWQNVP